MLILLSPAKSLSQLPINISEATHVRLLSDTWKLVKELKKLKENDLMQLMDISENLAHENRVRYKMFKKTHDNQNSLPAIASFDGDVYKGLSAIEWLAEDLIFAQIHLRILSGLYGVLRPFDLIQAYRLEMGTSLTTDFGKNLYDFWGDKISQLLKKDNTLKFISFNAKGARGQMARYLIKNKITEKEAIQSFDTDGYTFAEEWSTPNEWLVVK